MCPIRFAGSSKTRSQGGILKRLTATFLRGLVTLLPIAITVYVLVWLVTRTEALLARMFRFVLPDWLYHPGLGVLAGVLLVLAVGLVMELYVARRLWAKIEQLVQRIPAVKTLYGAVKDFGSFISESSRQRTMGQVVRVKVAEHAHVIGFVTREKFDDLPPGFGDPDLIAVYLPMSYQIGGYTVFLPRRLVEPVDMNVEDALRFAVTAGMSTHAPPS
jgi:uncharacterized membrane protein